MPRLYDEFTVRVECLDDSVEDLPEDSRFYNTSMEKIARLVAASFYADYSLPMRVTIQDEFEIRAKHERTVR